MAALFMAALFMIALFMAALFMTALFMAILFMAMFLTLFLATTFPLDNMTSPLFTTLTGRDGTELSIFGLTTLLLLKTTFPLAKDFFGILTELATAAAFATTSPFKTAPLFKTTSPFSKTSTGVVSF